ncbi:MAG: WecB/TagA/CpsF family glycosyltransferase [Planctomycetota bacterium]
MRDDGKRNVVGVMVDTIDYEAAVRTVADAARSRSPLSVTALAVHGVMTGVLDAEHRRRLNRFDMVAPDGQPVRWALNLLHRTRLDERVYGPELTLRVCARAEAEGLPLFLYGGSSEMLDTLADRLQDRFPNLSIAGRRPSLFRGFEGRERDEVVDEIKRSGARIVFVGLGCPRQEVFVYEMAPRVGLPMLAVGAAFAFHSGTSTMAPRWMQDRGLEWLYRLGQEPRRLWKRYLLLNPLYASLVTAQLIGLKRFGERSEAPPQADPLWG